MKKNPRYAFKHLSVRVPWHDNAWNGTVCGDPKSNSSCLILKNCALKRDDEKEQQMCGRSFKTMHQAEFPPCLKESGAMMADFEVNRDVSHPYVESSKETHGHLKATNLRFPAHSACTIPYAWMLKKNCAEKASAFDLDYDETREPELSWISDSKQGWAQEFTNQKALLNCFYEHFEPETSLVFFYAKQVPFVESSGRVITGVGRIKKIIPSDKYEGSNTRFSAAYWEHIVTHSIRKEMDDGFLLPYHSAVVHADENPDFNPADIAVFAPEDKQLEFSYGAEHVANDTAIRVLLECQRSWNKAQELGIGENHSNALKWIHDELHRIEKMRGIYPGMGAALCAFGIEKGHFIAAEIINGLKDERANPWKVFEQALDDPTGILSPGVAQLIPSTSARLYKKLLQSGSPDLKLIHLLSRFDLSIEQAAQLYEEGEREQLAPKLTTEAIINNPYLLYEATVKQWVPIAVDTIDLGLFIKNPPDDLLPEGMVSNDPFDPVRIRAITVRELTKAKWLGHTLLPRTQLITQIRDLAIEPKCEINKNYFELAEEVFPGAIHLATMKGGEAAYQLAELAKCREIIRTKVEARVSAPKELTVSDNWETLLDARLDRANPVSDPEREERARKEKLTAVRALARSRFSVLIGPAGTGKTTLLTTLASHPEIKRNGVLLLAPTGKARVRMEGMARDLSVTAKTLAQYLNSKKRFDGSLQLYKLSDQKDESYETVILDEASMLTEEMLATTLDCLEKAKRFILVGDHRQLPPIGAGRPFVDIIDRLRPDGIDSAFPKVGENYAELSVNMRTGGQNRTDLRLAEWFSGNPMEVGADSIINELLSEEPNECLRLEKWDTPTDFEKVFERVLVEELDLAYVEDTSGFNRRLGSDDGVYFNDTGTATYRKIPPSINKVESWQILSPVRDKAHGVTTINRRIHKSFRSQTVRDALYGRENNGYTVRRIPKPAGPEQIVYGDKVINLSNHHRRDVFPPDGALGYLANGEIGLVTGQFKKKSDRFPGQPQYIKIEFASQKGFTYTFRAWDFKDESEQPLELAYALTVHKSQGSEFETVFLVVPNPCFVLSREMLYTALTRQTKRVIVLHQGDIFDIKGLSSPLYSDIARRITNLFEDPEIVEIDGRYLAKNLIHQASDGQMVRSKSELLIYQRLLDKGLSPSYEKRLLVDEVEKLPDFTIENPDTGETYYWEHCGLMNDSEYVERWNEKRKWYLANGVTTYPDQSGVIGTLVVTEESLKTLSDGSIRGAFSVREIDEVIQTVFQR